jgi:DNA-binding NtrC family response regulator
MPGMLGPALAAEVRTIYPDISVVLKSGFADSVPDGALADDPRVRFITKPFTLKRLRATLAQVLDTAAASTCGGVDSG